MFSIRRPEMDCRVIELNSVRTPQMATLGTVKAMPGNTQTLDTANFTELEAAG